MKQIFLLIGPKGSGKSFIGSLFQSEFDIPFVRVEDWAKQIKKNRNITDDSYLFEVFSAIESGIREKLKQTDRLVFESTGLTDFFDQMLFNLKESFQINTIQIIADLSTCLNRIKTRDQSIHINVSDDQVNQINQAVLNKKMDTDFQIENKEKPKQQLIDEISIILDRISKK